MNDSSISSATVLARDDENFLFTEVDGEVVIMHSQSGKYFGLNPVSKDIWGYMEEPLSYEKILSRLLDEYDIDKDTCEKESKDFLKMMVKIKLIKIVE